MRVTIKEEIDEPLSTDFGERIFEMIGRPKEIGGTERHSLAHVELPPDSKSRSHYHEESEETYYILAGTASMTVDERHFRLTPGQACLIEPGEVHRVANESPEKDLHLLAISAPAWKRDDSYFTKE